MEMQSVPTILGTTLTVHLKEHQLFSGIWVDRSILKDQAEWLVKNVGPFICGNFRVSVGKGWRMEKQDKKTWTVTITNDKLATLFSLKFSC